MTKTTSSATKDNEQSNMKLIPQKSTIQAILAFAAAYQVDSSETLGFVEYLLN